ncbi:MAG: alpha/beta fold hydrolase [Desulfovibrionales bacterium]|nr:alpha/beta fold hydrolase [Desulfovibrionales bacterium]
MPICDTSAYAAPFFVPGGHLQTIVPSLFRRVSLLYWNRTRLDTIDGDFLDVDFHYTAKAVKKRRIAILCHGLEGDSHRAYIKGMARALCNAGWDVAAWNNRGCSGEPNITLRSYHCGLIDDLELVVKHCIEIGYGTVTLIGFSMGGNHILSYLGQRGELLPTEVQCAVTFSVPCSLAASNECLEQPESSLYTKRFLRSMKRKIREKHAQFQQDIDITRLAEITTLREYDDAYTAPLNGFRNAEDYWEKSSCGQFLQHITIPTLIVNAKNDPFLRGDCYPVREVSPLKSVYLEMPEQGGHVGFMARGTGGMYWSEKRALEFIAQALGY